jgi:hypothetical protein
VAVDVAIAGLLGRDRILHWEKPIESQGRAGWPFSCCSRALHGGRGCGPSSSTVWGTMPRFWFLPADHAIVTA